MYAEKVVAEKNSIVMNQITQFLFLNSPYAVIRLNMPIMPRCSGKLAMTSATKKTNPATA